MRKIVFHLNNLEKGGAERVASNLAGQLVKRGYEVHIATEWKGEDEYLLEEGVYRDHVGLNMKQEKKGRIRKILYRVTNLRKYLKETRPDVIIAFCKKAIYRGVFGCMGTNTPVIISVRTAPEGAYDGAIDRFLFWFVSRRANGAVFQTEKIMSFFPEKLQNKSRIIWNPLSERFLRCESVKERKKEIVTVGRIEKAKNQFLLVKAFAELSDNYPDYVLKIYGHDEDEMVKAEMVEFIAKKKLQTKVLFMGSSSQIEKEIAASAFFVLSSDKEGMPNALMEAMALGMPVIATNCDGGGAAELIHNKENGLLIPKGNQLKMEEAMRYMMDNPENAERMGKAAKQICKSSSIQAITDEWEKFIISVWE